MQKKSIKTIITITTIEKTKTTPKLLILLFKLINNVFTRITINYLTKIFFESPSN